jgi:hypothetical protein
MMMKSALEKIFLKFLNAYAEISKIFSYYREEDFY